MQILIVEKWRFTLYLF